MPVTWSVARRQMAYQYTEWENAPEPQASSSRSGGPPQKITGIGTLDPPLSPTNRTPGIPFARIVAAVILVLIAAAILLLLVPHC
jgi:hypothetical protein